MNKKLAIIISALCIVLMVLGVTVNYMEKNKQKPQERNTTETQSTSDTTETSVSGEAEEADKTESEADSEGETTAASEDDPDAWKTAAGDCTIKYDNLRIDFLSCDIIEDTDIETQTKYPVEYFKDEELPDGDFTEVMTDWDAVYAEAPEYEKAHKADCTNDEQLAEFMKIQEKYQDVIDKYTTESHPKTRYYFIKCRITNDTSASIESTLYLMGLSKLGDQMSQIEGCIYFDKSVHTEGEDRDSWYYVRTFEPGETLECTLGFEISQTLGEGETYYIGNAPVTDKITYNPDKLPDLVKLDNIPAVE